MINDALNLTLDNIDRLSLKHKRNKNEVNLLAVSKTFPIEAVVDAYNAGQRHFGENYLQDALNKIQHIKRDDINWHFIGSIQSNKTKDIAENFDWVHTIDREKIAKRLDQQRPNNFLPINCFIQINVSNDKNKGGLSDMDEISKLAHTIESLPSLSLKGLMTVPTHFDNFEQQKKEFDKLTRMLNTLKMDYPKLDSLSMGMTQDLEAAIAAGSTWVRIGTGIFGTRT